MRDRTYVYSIHIAASPDDVWRALTSAEAIAKYWPEWRLESDWRPGSPIRFYWAATGKLYSTGEVLDSDPPRRLVYTWPEHQPAPGDLPELIQWEIVPQGASVVVLTLTQERLSDESHEGACSGWPMIISSIKTLLETGRALPIDGRPKVNLEF